MDYSCFEFFFQWVGATIVTVKGAFASVAAIMSAIIRIFGKPNASLWDLLRKFQWAAIGGSIVLGIVALSSTFGPTKRRMEVFTTKIEMVAFGHPMAIDYGEILKNDSSKTTQISIKVSMSLNPDAAPSIAEGWVLSLPGIKVDGIHGVNTKSKNVENRSTRMSSDVEGVGSLIEKMKSVPFSVGEKRYGWISFNMDTTRMDDALKAIKNLKISFLDVSGKRHESTFLDASDPSLEWFYRAP